MSRYHPKAKTINPQGRSLKLTNLWAIPPRLRQAIESTFLTAPELFGSPFNCSMSDGITYYSAFPGGRGFRSNNEFLPTAVE